MSTQDISNADLFGGVDQLLQLVNVGSGQVSHLGLGLDEEEGGHGSDL